jgi:hypothetical protein
MPNSRRVRITLYVDPHAEPIQGQLLPEGQPAQPFSGWIELTSVIETARHDVSGHSGQSPAS